MKKKIIAYVKHEGANLNGMIVASKLVVKYETLSAIGSLIGTCFSMHFLRLVNIQLMMKACLRALNMFL